MEHDNIGIPISIEYSAKNDKFRLQIYLIDEMYQSISEINMARMNTCSLCEYPPNITLPNPSPKECVILELEDERNAMERAMLQFSYFEKETIQLDEKHYQMTIFYNKMEETELLIQILSFGAMLTVIEPEPFRQKIKERIEMQYKLTLF